MCKALDMVATLTFFVIHSLGRSASFHASSIGASVMLCDGVGAQAWTAAKANDRTSGRPICCKLPIHTLGTFFVIGEDVRIFSMLNTGCASQTDAVRGHHAMQAVELLQVVGRTKAAGTDGAGFVAHQGLKKKVACV